MVLVEEVVLVAILAMVDKVVLVTGYLVLQHHRARRVPEVGAAVAVEHITHMVTVTA